MEEARFWLFPTRRGEGPQPSDAELDVQYGAGRWARVQKYGYPAIEVGFPCPPGEVWIATAPDEDGLYHPWPIMGPPELLALYHQEDDDALDEEGREDQAGDAEDLRQEEGRPGVLRQPERRDD